MSKSEIDNYKKRRNFRLNVVRVLIFTRLLQILIPWKERELIGRHKVGDLIVCESVLRNSRVSICTRQRTQQEVSPDKFLSLLK